MKKRVMSWGTMMCDIIAPEAAKVAEPGVIEYLEKGIEMRPGGHPVDVIVDLARIGVNPDELAVVSTIGSDLFGDFILNELRPYGFKTYIERVPGGTGKTLILTLRGKDRLCHLDPAACGRMSLEHLESALREAQPEFFSFRPGYTSLDLEIGPLLKRLRQDVLRGSFLLLDLCAPYRKEWSYYLGLLPYVDAVHGNAGEITRAAGAATSDEAAEKLLRLGVKMLLLTKDKDGAEMITPSCRIVQPAFEVDFVEPSGCGDAFCAGVFYALMQSGRKCGAMGRDELAEVLRWGQAMGAAAATRVGCVDGVTAETVFRLMGEEGSRSRSASQAADPAVKR